jgi:hypothetical protein
VLAVGSDRVAGARFSNDNFLVPFAEKKAPSPELPRPDTKRGVACSKAEISRRTLASPVKPKKILSA